MDLTPVVVVGAGPVGMVTALELARHGIPCALVERGTETTRLPKMDITSARSMELLARLGVADDIRRVGVRPDRSYDVVWSTGLDGDVVTTWHLPSTNEMWRRIGEVNDGTQPSQAWQRLSQIDLEPVLWEQCRRCQLIDLWSGWELVSLDQDPTGVTAQLVQGFSGEHRVVRSSYLVGCDGASSTVRETVGIDMEASADLPELPGAFLVHFKSPDLEQLHRHGHFWHYFAFAYVIIAQDERDTWTLHVHARDATDFSPPPTDPAALVRSTLGVDLTIDDVLVTSRWRPKFLTARRYRAGRVVLAGDAVHQMFPTGGYGMNTGVADAVDLGWKLAATLRGWGGPRLLESYELERRPVALDNLAVSRRHIGVHFAAGDLLRSGRPLGEVASFLQTERGENEYSGVELGYRYRDSPVVCQDGTPEPSRDPLRYTPTTWPGGRPPSVLLARGGALFDRLGPRFSLVDFAGDGRARPLLAEATRQGLPVRHTVVRDGHARDLWEHDLVLVRPDQHVAWRGNTAPPDPSVVIRRVRGDR